MKTTARKKKSEGVKHRQRNQPKDETQALNFTGSKTRFSDTLEKTRNLYNGDARSTRITVEVLDDASPDSTPRQDYELKKNIAIPSLTVSDAKTISIREDRYGKLPFQAEKNRVVSKNDTFVPAPNISITDIDVERDRLSRLEDIARIKQLKYDSQSSIRRQYLEQDKSALRIQALFRGYLGRKKYLLTRRLQEMIESDRTGGWVEVRDKGSGDVWFYNTKSGISQWDRPVALRGVLAADNSLKKLPDLKIVRSNGKNASTSLAATTSFPLLEASSPSASPASKLQAHSKQLGKAIPGSQQIPSKSLLTSLTTDNDSQEDDLLREEVSREIREVLGVNDWNPPEALLGPDGSFKPQLRSTIMNALLDHRFNSLSSVLADDRFLRRNKQFNSTSMSVSASSDHMDLSRKPMVSVLTINKRRQRKVAQLRVDDEPSKNARPKSAPENSAADISKLTVRDVSHPGFEAAETNENAQEAMCFGCWSSGSRSCSLHKSDQRLKPSQTMLLCRNWELGVMRRRYRSEEIQEVFMQKAASLKYDMQRKRFLTVSEKRHPIYRMLYNLLGRFNFRSLVGTKVKRWLLSFTDQIRCGLIKPSRTGQKAKQIRLRRSLKFQAGVSNFTRSVRHKLPIPPITGYSWPERSGTKQYLFSHRDEYLKQDVEIIVALPYPVPVALYTPRAYHLPAPISIPMPQPEYSVQNSSTRVTPSNTYIPDGHPAAWLEQLSSSLVRDCVRQATSQIRSITPLPGAELIRRTKYPVPCTIKFATLGRKPTPGLLAIGGLPVELLVSQLITTFVPAQFGNIMVMDKSTISPGITPEVTISFSSLPMPPVTQPFNPRPVDHPLNYRRAPTICINSKVSSSDKFYYGTNRPEQTGEQLSHGFRTTAWARHLLCHVETSPKSFTPGAEVASLNATRNNQSNTTHADSTYPFCDPSTRDNTTLDFFHLLLTGTTTMPKAQVFTALTVQEAGEFLKSARADLPLGHVVAAIYRSWAFTQKDTIEEFVSDDGIKYWYHRRTGMTFWERPLHKEEEESPLKGGTLLDQEHREEPLMVHHGIEGASRRYLQGDFRKIMLNHHETSDEAISRRRQANTTAGFARQKGILPPPIKVPASVQVTLGNELAKLESVQSNTFTQAAQPSSSAFYSSRPLTGNSHGTHFSTESNILNEHGSLRSMLSPAKQIDLYGSLENNGSRGDTLNNNGGDRNAQQNLAPLSGIENSRPSRVVEQEALGSLPLTTGSLGINPIVLSSVTQTVEQIFSAVSGTKISANDMMQLGLGLGIALAQSQQLGTLRSAPISQEPKKLFENTFQEETRDDTSSISAFESAVQPEASTPITPMIPIGAVEPTIFTNANVALNHREEKDRCDELRALSTVPLSNVELVKELKVVPTPTPDLRFDENAGFELEPPLNAEECAKDKVPVVVYPELYPISSTLPSRQSPPPDYRTHTPAGVGTSFVLTKEKEKELFVAGSRTLRRTAPPLPVGFFEAICAKHVAKQLVDYLPQVPNLPQTRTVGRVKPRSAAVDWLAIAFDPWSAGKSPLNADFIASLESKVEKIYGAARARDEMEAMKLTVDDGVLDINDSDGLAEQRLEATGLQQIADDFKKMASLARNGKFREVEELMNQPDWNVPIDYQDDQGNTLMHISAQNGNKRMIKLCLRRGGDINLQNINGQTPLHFAYAYGYEKLGEYMMRKGADDSIRNKDGLTCYEGLSSQELNLL